jgi:dihydrofolate reductase
MKTLVMVVLTLFVFANMSVAQEPAVITSSKTGWHKIGETKADFKTESEGILVMGKDTFKSIKLKVTDAPVNINKVIIYFENKQMQEVPIDGVINAGMESKMIDLDYPSVEIQKVVFTYKSEPSYQGDKAHVELHGLK